MRRSAEASQIVSLRISGNRPRRFSIDDVPASQVHPHFVHRLDRARIEAGAFDNVSRVNLLVKKGERLPGHRRIVRVGSRRSSARPHDLTLYLFHRLDFEEVAAIGPDASGAQ